MKLCELRWQDPATQTYLGSPSLVRLPGGDLLATHDYFGPGCPRNHENEEHLTSVYRSNDDGKTWRNITHISNCFWSTLFLHGGSVYLLGTSQQYGSIVIRRSDDGGNTWTHSDGRQKGVLFQGGTYHEAPNYHCAPVPVLFSQGRLYRAFEDCDPCRWPSGFRACVISAAATSDLLDGANWSMSNKLAFDPAWLPPSWGKIADPGWLEGNCVETPGGELWNVLRLNSDPLADKAALVRVDDKGRHISFDPATGFIDFPGGHTKFTIRYDPVTRQYLTLSNPNPRSVSQAERRNTLALCASADLRHWSLRQILLVDDSGLSELESCRATGFQYVDWQFDNEDIIYLVRIAYHNAHNYHDSNRITFHRLNQFRRYLYDS